MFLKSRVLLLAAITALGGAPSASAEEEDVFDLSLEELAEVVAIGIRGSLQQSLERKRNARNIVDAITAEDIGAFPDQNLAEALQRVSGVAIDRKSGEGAFTSIRGLGPQFVRVTANGRTLPSNVDNQAAGDAQLIANDGSRIVSFDQFQSGLVQALEVYKSPQADLIEGGLGGIVNVQTRRPLDIGKRALNFNVLGTFNALAESSDPRVSGLFNDTFADETLGFMVSASWDDRTVREDEIDIPDYDMRAFDLDGDGATDVSGFMPANLRGAFIEEERERLNVSSALQWRPSHRLEIALDVLYTQFNREPFILRLPFRTQAGISNAIVDAVQETDNGEDILTFFETAGARPRTFPYFLTADTDGISIGGNVDFQLNQQVGFNFDLALSENETHGSTDSVFYDAGPALASFDIRNRFIGTYAIDEDLNDPNRFTHATLTSSDSLSVDEELQARADVRYDFEQSWLESIQAGIAFRDRQRDDRTRGFSTNAFLGEPLTDIGTIAFPTSDFLTGINTNFPTSWIVPDVPVAMHRFLVERRDEIPSTTFDNATQPTSSDIQFEEQSLAGFVMLDLAGSMGETPYTGNVGVRIVETDQTTAGLVQDVEGFFTPPGGTASTIIFGPPNLERVDTSYTEILPSFNLRFELRDDLLFRFAGAKVMSRPGFAQLNPGQVSNASLRLIASGNPNLDPITAWQTDLALEWYFAEYAIVAVSPFMKWVDSFITQATTTQTLPDIDPDTGQPVVLNIVQPRNEKGARVGGVELIYQQAFGGLPEPFDGLGVQFNYTFVDTDAEFVNPRTGSTFDVPGLSRNTFNAVVFYEKGRLSGRLAFNQRDEFLASIADTRGNPLFTRKFNALDASLSYRFNDKVTFSFEGINLTDENVVQFNTIGRASREFFNFENNTGRRFTAGVRVQLGD